MGSPSVSTHRGLVHWKRLLLFVLLLTFWSRPTTAKISIVSTHAAEGKDVVLRIHNKPPEVVGIVWYKGTGEDQNNVISFFIKTSSFHLSGPENNGRQILKDDGSLLLKKVTMKDRGTYTIVAHYPDSETEIGFGQLDVYESEGFSTCCKLTLATDMDKDEHLRGPMLIASSYAVIENEEDVVLTCYTNGLYIQWLFNDMNLQFSNRTRLSRNSRRLTIDPVKREDAGVYKCIAWNPITWVESRPLELHVLY